MKQTRDSRKVIACKGDAHKGDAQKRDAAVSPVVAVMLMIVVTVIIAAVVSGFSGGFVKDTKKAPQASISATFSQSDGMQIFHNGGDTLSTQDIILLVKPTRTFGNYQHLSWVINKSVITTNKTKWVDPTVTESYKLARNFQPGECAFINASDLPYVQEKNGGTADYYSPEYGFGNTTYSRGNRFTLKINDQNGQPIATTEVQIKP